MKPGLALLNAFFRDCIFLFLNPLPGSSDRLDYINIHGTVDRLFRASCFLLSLFKIKDS